MSDTRPWSDVDYTVVDVEGNGQRPPDLVELAVVHVTGGQIGEPVVWLVQPSAPITWPARKVHGISNADVADAAPFDAVAGDVLEHLGGVIVGHNVGIDLDVLRRKLPDWRPTAVVDTLRLARKLMPDLSSHRLGALVEALGLAEGLPPGLQPHRAAYDVLVTARLLQHLATAHEQAGTWAGLHETGRPPKVVYRDDTTDSLF